MPTFERFEVVAAPFPYIERPVQKRRPCLVVGSPDQSDLVWVVMITSAGNEGWPQDINIADVSLAGLKASSVVRTAKIATVKNKVLKPIGRLDASTAKKVAALLKRHWLV